MPIYFIIEQSRESTYKTRSRHLEKTFKTFQINLDYEMDSLRRSFHEIGSAKLIRNCTKKGALASISRFAIFSGISLQIKDILVKWRTNHNQTTMSMYFH